MGKVLVALGFAVVLVAGIALFVAYERRLLSVDAAVAAVPARARSRRRAARLVLPPAAPDALRDSVAGWAVDDLKTAGLQPVAASEPDASSEADDVSLPPRGPWWALRGSGAIASALSLVSSLPPAAGAPPSGVDDDHHHRHHRHRDHDRDHDRDRDHDHDGDHDRDRDHDRGCVREGRGEKENAEALSRAARVSIEEIQAMREDGLGWGVIAQNLGVAPGSAPNGEVLHGRPRAALAYRLASHLPPRRDKFR